MFSCVHRPGSPRAVPAVGVERVWPTWLWALSLPEPSPSRSWRTAAPFCSWPRGGGVLTTPVRATLLTLMPALWCTHVGLWAGTWGRACVCRACAVGRGCSPQNPMLPAHGRVLAAWQAQVLAVRCRLPDPEGQHSQALGPERLDFGLSLRWVILLVPPGAPLGISRPRLPRSHGCKSRVQCSWLRPSHLGHGSPVVQGWKGVQRGRASLYTVLPSLSGLLSSSLLCVGTGPSALGHLRLPSPFGVRAWLSPAAWEGLSLRL